MIKEKLQKLGFTSTDADVYCALMELGKAKAGELIQQTRLPRSAVYASLADLENRQLVSVTSASGVAVYRMNDPFSLVEEVERSKLLAQSIAEEMQRKIEVPAREVAVYEGREGIMRVADRCFMEPAGETIYFLGPSKFGEQVGLEMYWKKFHKKRIQKGLYSKILYDRSTDSDIVENRSKMPDSEARYLPLGANMPIWFLLYGDNLSIIVPGEEPLLIFQIKSRTAAEGMKKYFDYFWNMS